MKVRSNKIFAYFSLVSMLANTLAPFSAMIPASAYAEDISAPVEVSTEPAEEPASEEIASEDSEEAVIEDEVVEEIGGMGDLTEEILEDPSEEIIDPEAPDIIDGGGVMDYNPINDIEEVVEVEEIPTPVEEEVTPEVEEPVQIEYEELSDDAEITDSVKEDWAVDVEVAETIDNVKLGVKYIFPLDEEVTLTFTRLPKEEELRSHLKIERVKVEDLDLPDDFVTDAEYAFDITTDMENGDFEFDLTLPKPEGSEAEVSYIEKSIDEAKEELKDEDIKKVEEGRLEQDEEDDNVKVKDLDHLTLFIPVNGVELSVSGSFDGATQVTVDPGDTIEIDIIVERTGSGDNNDWESTSWRIDEDTWNCENHGDHTHGEGTSSETFDITAPLAYGTYDISFRAHRNDSCGSSGVSINTFTLTDGIIVEEAEPVVVCNNSSDDYGLDSSVGIWTSVDEGSNINGIDTNEVRWGNSTGYGQSGLRFDPIGTQTFNENTQFLLGTLTHMNWPITNAADGATLEITLDFDKPDILDQSFSYDFDIEETTNGGSCPSWQESDTPCDDKITFPTSYGNSVITIDDIQYTLVIDGFVDAYTCGSIGSVLNYFITEERKDNSAYLIGHLSSILIEEPAISIIKKTNNEDITDSGSALELTVGDIVTWQYIIQNTGNVDLENISVVDNQEVTVDCGEQTTLASGASMTCTASDTATEGNYSNIATVTGTPPTGADVTDSDTSWYKGVLPPTGSIRIIKNAIPDNDQDFTFTSLNNSLGSFTLDDDGDDGNTYKNYIVFKDIPLGTHQITEDVPSGWSLSGISCVSNGEWAPNGSTLTVDVVPGEEVVCTFTNTLQTGTLKVVKSVDDDYPLSKFSFRLDGGSWIPAANGTGEVNFGQVTPGSHYIEESISEPGYIFKAVTGDSNCSYNENTHKIEAIVNAGQETVCYVENEYEKGQLEIIKDVVPNDSSQWDISINDFTETLGDSGSTGTVTLRRGQYTVTEEAHSGTNGNDYTSSYVCEEEILDDSGKPITQTVKSGFGSTFDIWVGRDDDIICTFTNTRNPYCGDGIINGQEECDYSELNGKSICSSECALVKECLPNMAANGGFEIPTVNDPLKWDIFTNAQVPGWTAEWYGASGGDNDPQIELHAGVNGWTSINNQYVELDSDWDGPGGGLNGEAASISIYQNIPVIKDYEYRVSWSYSPRPNHDNNRLEVKVGTDSVFDSGVIAGGGSVSWMDESYTFVPDSDDVVKISFTEIGNPDSYGMFLDNVSIECLGKPPLRLQAQKVMCDSEQYLPNERSGLSAITNTTATNWVANSNGHCWIEDMWQFQWGPKDSGSNGSFQTDTSLLGDPWNTFTPSDVVEIRDLGELNGRLEVREVIPEGYTNPLVPFSNDSGNNYSSEFYCTGDIRNYDNWEWISNPQADTDYYCVGFDAYEYNYITGYKWNDRDGDGRFDGNESGLEGWNIKAVLPDAVDSFKVYANDVYGTDSKVLPAGDYLIIVEDTWQDTSQSNHYIDAEYYTFDSWESYVDGTGGSGGNQKDLQINNNLTNWGSYSDEHDFYYNYQQVSDGSANFAIYDGNAGGKIPSWYGDNEGSLTVTIYEVVDSTWTDADGSYELTIPGSIPDVRVFEIPQIGWVREYPELPYHVVTFDGPGDTQININFGNRIDEPVTIIATKIVCDYEEDLPNYGYGAPVNITENTASNWIASHPNCRLEPDWSFQWGDDGDTNPSDSHVGEVEGWNTFGPTNSDGTVVVEINDFGYTSQIKVREVLKENYIPFTYLTNGNNSDNFSAEIYCHTDVLNYDNDDRFTPEYGETYYCVAWNVQETYGIHGYKWDDQILNGIRDCNDDNADIVMASSTRGCRNWAEPTLPGWTINLYRWVDEAFETEPFKTTLTSSEPGDDFGWYWFEDLPPGRYKICEVQQNGWEQTFPVNESDNCHIVDLPDGNPNGYAVMENSLPEPEPAYNFGNEFITPRASIAKWNDSSEPEEVGNEVMFTIRVTAHDNDVVDAYAYDLFSEGFEYIDGSWTAESSDGRDLKALGITFEPEYASPASWYLGEIEEGEEVTLTYLARVTDQVDPGIYKDLAWTQGEDLLGGEVLGYAESEGYIDDDTFVGTEVEVVVENEIEDEVDVKEEEIGEVLGASTELPATGASTFWVNLMLVLASIGGLLLLIGGFGTMSTKKQKTMKKGKKAILSLVTLGFLTLFSFKVYAAPIVVRLSEPQSPVGGEFDLVFVAMDIGDNEMTATCEVKKPGSASFTQFGSKITIDSGDSGDSRTCAVTDSVLDDDGEYKFRVVVDPGDVSSNEVTVDYDGDGPDRPKYIEKEKVNNCVNKITLKTADDDETTSVQIFADDDKEIDIDDSHKIETESIGPDEKFDFEHIVSGDDCDKTWYYAVVAFDDAGNASKPRSEVITTTTTTTEEGEEEETGAIPVEGGAGIVEGGATTGGEGAEGTEGTEGNQGTEVNVGEGEEGSVLGEQTGGEGKVIFKSPWFWIVAVGLGIVIISATRKKKA